MVAADAALWPGRSSTDTVEAMAVGAREYAYPPTPEDRGRHSHTHITHGVALGAAGAVRRGAERSE